MAAAGHELQIAHTGQHYDAIMSDVFFDDLNIPEPDWFLNVGSGTHAVQTGTAMMRLEELFVEEKPDAVIVVGDVNSTLAGALAASKVHLPVIHLEAGLRSFDMSMPEEVNRLVSDQISAMHLTPTAEAGDNLIAENVVESRIHFVGNIMAESVLRHLSDIEDREVSSRFGLEQGAYVLSTVRRPENTDHPEKLGEIAAAFNQAPHPVLLPVHPRTRPVLADHGMTEESSNIVLTDPVGYLDMLALQRDAAAIVTDSGGVQEESCMLGTPCVTVRRNTERGITIEVGANRLVSAEREAILGGLSEALTSGREWERPERWDAEVGERIGQALGSGIEPMVGYEKGI
jgi:UDP-N-acetylglucosamine 2-epimerase (non-hydrolysing)